MDIKKDQLHNTQVMVVGDFNENVFSKSLNDIFSKVGLVNIVQDNIDYNNDCRSYFRGKHIIDGVWASPMEVENITSFRLAPFYYLVPSMPYALL